MLDITLLAAILAAIVPPTLGYVYTRKKDLDFERRKTNYHAKLQAFQQMNDALSRMITNLAHMKSYFSQRWTYDTPEQLSRAAIQLMTFASLAREDERALGATGVTDDIKERALGFEKMETIPRDEFEEWLQESLLSLFLLRFRLFAHNDELFTRAFFAADIVSQSDELEKEVSDIMQFIASDLGEWFANTQSDPIPKGEIERWYTRLESQATRLRRAMQDELDDTLS